MSSLRDLQAAFAAAVLDRDEGFSSAIAPGGPDGRERLAVYRNNARHNFRDALRAVYPVVGQLVGDEFFAFAADRYRDGHPSTSGDIHHYGDRFADFLASFQPAAGLPYLPDAARLEWAMHAVFHAEDAAPFGLDQLSGLGDADLAALVFELNPACRLLRSPYAVDRLWMLHQPGVPWDDDFDLASGPAAMLVKRDGYAVEVERLSEAEFAALATLAAEGTLAAGYDEAVRVDPAFDFGGFLLRYLPAVRPAEVEASRRDQNVIFRR